jgi:hypothetical protein
MCVVCMEKIDLHNTTLVCGHKFCFECIKKWSGVSNDCPVWSFIYF